MTQVHKENLTHVENAIGGRQGLDIEIFGMEGVPADIVDSHNQQVTQKHFAEEAERARLTGNPVRGTYANGQALPSKLKKVDESLEEIEQRANKFRYDRQNGILPAPVVEAVPKAVSVGVGVLARARARVRVVRVDANEEQTPPAAAPAPYAAPPSAFPSANNPFPSQPALPFPTNGAPPGSIPSALPPRPGFGLPPGFPPNGAPDTTAIHASVDDLIGSVAASAAAESKKEEKKSKKNTNFKLIFFDESVSPEEKMARLPRFAVRA
jgi:hypothetical protein